MDWSAIREEYLAGGVSQKRLAERWGVPLGALRQRAREEGWTARRDAARAAEDDAELARRARRALLRKLERMARALPEEPVTEFKAQDDGAARLFKLRDFTAAFKEALGDLPLDGDRGEGVRIVVDP